MRYRTKPRAPDVVEAVQVTEAWFEPGGAALCPVGTTLFIDERRVVVGDDFADCGVEVAIGNWIVVYEDGRRRVFRAQAFTSEFEPCVAHTITGKVSVRSR